MIRVLVVILILGAVGEGAAWARGHVPLYKKQEIEDPGDKGLRHVFRQLSCLARHKRRVVRIAHYGDSIMVDDRVSSAMRQRLQARFGDGGPGFLVLRPRTTSYRRSGIKMWTYRKWKRATMLGRWPKSGHFGYAGVINWSLIMGARLYMIPRKEGRFGGRASRLLVHYQQRPLGGIVRLRIGLRELGRINTRGPVKKPAVGTIKFPETGAKLVLEHAGGGTVRIYGVALERKGPGVVVDGLGMKSSTYHNLGRIAASHWRQQLEQRGVGLVIFQYGANASDLKRIGPVWYKGTVRTVLGRLKAARPRVSCLVVGPVDRGTRGTLLLKSRAIMRRISKWQKQVALAKGCAFFDSRAAQGGRGAARRWRRARPHLLWPDLLHLTPAGSKVMGDLVSKALLRAYDRYIKKHGKPACGGGH